MGPTLMLGGEVGGENYSYRNDGSHFRFEDNFQFRLNVGFGAGLSDYSGPVNGGYTSVVAGGMLSVKKNAWGYSMGPRVVAGHPLLNAYCGFDFTLSPSTFEPTSIYYAGAMLGCMSFTIGIGLGDSHVRSFTGIALSHGF